jgi:putative MFS transporter
MVATSPATALTGQLHGAKQERRRPEKPSMQDELIAARIDRLPYSRLHWRILALLAIPQFFDSVDIFTFPSAAPGLVKFWGLSIDDVALITSAAFFGMFLGAALGGALADRLGRRRGLLLFVTLGAGASLLTALAQNVPMLFAARVVTGFGLAAGIVTTMTCVAEFFPAERRGKSQAMVMVIGLFAIPITNWIARQTVPNSPDGWRYVFAWGAVGFAFLIATIWLPESPRWLARQGRFAEAETMLRRMEDAVARQVGTLPEPRPVSGANVARAPWATMFGPDYRRRTTVLCVLWILQTLGFYGFEAWVPTLLVTHGITLTRSLTYVTLMNIGAPIGALLAFYVSDRFERKHSIALTAAAIAVFGLLYGLSFVPALIVVFGLLVGLLIQTFASLIYAYTPEQFPTDLRNGATGFTYSLGRLANVANAFIIAAIFTHIGYVAVFGYIAGAWLLTAALTLLLGPRTTGQRLEALNPLVADAFAAPVPIPVNRRVV